jgi:hypothetical protein
MNNNNIVNNIINNENIDNKKKLLCYNVVNYGSCLYKNKCLFAHNLEEQKKEAIRELIYNIIYYENDLSEIYLNEDKELLNDLVLYTKECKNCINNKCPGGYNCKYGVCKKEMKICYNDLMNGKCKNDVIKNNNITKCINGVHLTEKKLIPYNERIYGEYNFLNDSIMNNNLINYNYKLNTISVLLNDDTIKTAKILIEKNFKSLVKNINKNKNITRHYYNIDKDSSNSSEDEIIYEIIKELRNEKN